MEKPLVIPCSHPVTRKIKDVVLPMATNITAGHHRIHQIVKLLENIPKKRRDHKCQYQTYGISPGHIICLAE